MMPKLIAALLILFGATADAARAESAPLATLSLGRLAARLASGGDLRGRNRALSDRSAS